MTRRKNLFRLDPPSEVSIPSEDSTTDTILETTSEPITTTNIIETTSTTVMPTLTTTETTITTSPTTTTTTTTLPLINEAQIHNERISTTTTTKMINYSYRTKNSSTQHWLQSYHTSTERVEIDYLDRSKLDLCDGFYDAITMYKGILFIFKGQVGVFIDLNNWICFSPNLVFLAI